MAARTKEQQLQHYRARLAELRHSYTTQTQILSISIPQFLHKEWQRRKRSGDKMVLSKVLASAMHWSLFGPHQFSDPVEALQDAFDVYIEHGVAEKLKISQMIVKMAKENGIDLKTALEAEEVEATELDTTTKR